MLIMAILLCTNLTSIFAAENNKNIEYREDFPSVPKERQLERLVDDAKLLSESNSEQLLKKLNEISDKYMCDVVIVTIDSLNSKEAKAYADDFYDKNGYGYGENDDGILLLISKKDRKWSISTFGFGIKAFTDKGQEYIIESMKPYLSDNNFYEAFDKFADLCDEFIAQAKTGNPYDKNSMPFTPLSISWIFISLVSGAVLSFLIMFAFKSQLKSVVKNDNANSYILPESLNISKSKDVFLYSNVTMTEKPKDNDSGGSTTNTSSSGRSHGGSSGSF